MSEIRLTMIGDTFVSRPDAAAVFTGVTKYFEDSDVNFCNLETVLADEKYLDPTDQNGFPRTDEWMFEAHVKAGINVVSQANNPNTYHGHAPLVRSLEVLDGYGVAHAGAGRDVAEARRPAVVERKGVKVAFVCRTSVGIATMAATDHSPGLAYYPAVTSYAPSSHEHHNPINYPGEHPIVITHAAQGEHRAALEEDIARARELADVVVVPWHWGLSPTPSYYPGATFREVEVLEYMRELGHMAIDFGADMVVGTGPHDPAPIEVYHGKPIFYSLANFVHDRFTFNNKNLFGMMVRCVIRDGRLDRVAFVPSKIKNNGPAVFSPPAEASEVVEYLRDISAIYGTQFEIGDDDVTVVLNPAE